MPAPRIYPRAEGGYRVVYYESGGAGGTAGARRFRSFPTEKEAKDFVASLGEDKRLGFVKAILNLRTAAHAYIYAERPRLRLATVKMKTNVIAAFVSAFRDEITPDDITPQMAEGYLTEMARRGVRGTTINGVRAAIKTMWAWFLKNDWAKDSNPWRETRPWKVEPRKPGFVPSNRVREFLAACSPALRLPAHLAIYAGLRRREVVELQWFQVDLQRGSIQIEQSKSHRPRRIPIHPELAAVLAAEPKRSGYVVVSQYGRPMSLQTSGWTAMAQEVGRKLGLGRINFHGLRATCATLLAESGASQVTIQAILGHSRESMTWLYTQATDKAIEHAMASMTVPAVCQDCASEQEKQPDNVKQLRKRANKKDK